MALGKMECKCWRICICGPETKEEKEKGASRAAARLCPQASRRVSASSLALVKLCQAALTSCDGAKVWKQEFVVPVLLPVDGH